MHNFKLRLLYAFAFVLLTYQLSAQTNRDSIKLLNAGAYLQFAHYEYNQSQYLGWASIGLISIGQFGLRYTDISKQNNLTFIPIGIDITAAVLIVIAYVHQVRAWQYIGEAGEMLRPPKSESY